MSVTAKEIADALGVTPENLAVILAGGAKLATLVQGDQLAEIVAEGKWSRARKDIAIQLAYVNQRAAVLRAEHEQRLYEAMAPVEQELARLTAISRAIEAGDLSQAVLTTEEIDARLGGK